jgi:hypothetical protein
MRLISTTIALAALLSAGLVSWLSEGIASAAEGKEAGKGAASPPPGGESPGGGKAVEFTDTRDRATDTTSTLSNKTWEVGAGFEYHRLVQGDYTGGTRYDLNLNYYTLNGKWEPTPYDRVSVKWGLYQGYLVDMNEPRVRSDDILFTYTRRIPLPGAVTMRASLSLTAPVSYASQLGGLYTSPRLSVQADRKFGRYFSLDGRLAGSFYIQKYTVGGFSYTGGGISEGDGVALGKNGGGGNPSTKGSLSMTLAADFAMPFHEPLSIGADGYVAWAWLYNPCGGTQTGSMHEGSFGYMLPTTTCNLPAINATDKQPFRQLYGAEIYVRYALPNFKGFKSDVTLTWAPLGDPTMGYYNPLHTNGTPDWLAQYYQLNEFYLSLSGRY